jgi:hypothetical protein
MLYGLRLSLVDDEYVVLRLLARLVSPMKYMLLGK